MSKRVDNWFVECLAGQDPSHHHDPILRTAFLTRWSASSFFATSNSCRPAASHCLMSTSFFRRTLLN
eukprot:4364836-Lingulodinium_polyedra.AAC.1